MIPLYSQSFFEWVLLILANDLISHLSNYFINIVSVLDLNYFYHYLIVDNYSFTFLDIFIAILSGIVIGFSLGLIGGGGSILAVPLLVYVIGIDVHMAIGTSALVVAVNAFINLLYRFGKKCIKIKEGILFAIPGAFGAIVGAQLGLLTPSKNLLIFFAFFMFIVAAWMLISVNKKNKKIDYAINRENKEIKQIMTPKDKNKIQKSSILYQKDELFQHTENMSINALRRLFNYVNSYHKIITVYVILGIKLISFFKKDQKKVINGHIRNRDGSYYSVLIKGCLVGMAAGYFGIGGGFLIVPALLHTIPEITMIESIATSLIPVSAFGFITSIKYIAATQINWFIAILFIIGGAIGGIMGTKLSNRIPKEKLSATFAVLLIIIACYIISKIVLHF